jgi:hypothetical protein
MRHLFLCSWSDLATRASNVSGMSANLGYEALHEAYRGRSGRVGNKRLPAKTP